MLICIRFLLIDFYYGEFWCIYHTAWGLRCSFYDMGKFEGLDSGTATIRFHAFYIDN